MAKIDGSALKAYNDKYSAEFMYNYCKDNGKADWWNSTIAERKVAKNGKVRRISLTEVRSAFVREFFPDEVKSKKAGAWRKLI